MDHPFEPLLYQSAALGQAQGSLLYQSLCAGGPCPLPSGELVDLWLFDGLRQRASPSQVGPTHRYHSSQTYDQPIGDLGIRLIGGFEAADTPEPHQYNLPSFAPLQTATVTHELLLLLGGDLCPFDLLFMGGHGPWLVTGRSGSEVSAVGNDKLLLLELGQHVEGLVFLMSGEHLCGGYMRWVLKFSC